MSRLTDIALSKIEELNTRLSEAEAKLAEREAQLAAAYEALTVIRERGIRGDGGMAGEIASAALARLPQPADLLRDLRSSVPGRRLNSVSPSFIRTEIRRLPFGGSRKISG